MRAEIRGSVLIGEVFEGALRSSQALLWQVYQPADDKPESKPLFVFFNGGPGGATSAGLFIANTGRNAVFVDPQTGESSIIINPHSWTRIGTPGETSWEDTWGIKREEIQVLWGNKNNICAHQLLGWVDRITEGAGLCP